MNMMTMYMLTRLDALCVFFGIACTVSIVCTVIIVSLSIMEPDIFEFPRRAVKYSVITLIITTCGAILIPSTKTMAAIIIVPKIVNSTVVQKDVPELYDLGIEWLKGKLVTGGE